MKIAEEWPVRSFNGEELRVLAGTGFDTAIQRSIRIANDLQRPVWLVFNGVHHKIRPGDSPTMAWVSHDYFVLGE